MPRFICEFSDHSSPRYRCIATDKSKYGVEIFAIEKLATDALGKPAWCPVQNVDSSDEILHTLLSAIDLEKVHKSMTA